MRRAQARKGCTDHEQLPPHGDGSWHHTKPVASGRVGVKVAHESDPGGF